VEALRREIARLRDENEAARRRIAVLEVMQQIARSLSSELNLEPLLQMILASAVRVIDAAAGSLLMLDRATHELVFEVIEGGGGAALEKTRMPATKGIAGWVVTHGEPLIVDDVHRDARYYPNIAEDYAFATDSILCVPLIAKGDVIGVLQLLNKTGGKRFSMADQELLSALAAQSAVAIDNARLYQSLRDERDRILAVEEEVRHRLARDLHDGPAQMLAALIMSTNFVREALAHNAMSHVFNELAEMMPIAEKALYQVRTLLFDLRPVILETQGLIPALESYTHRLRENENLDIALCVDGEFGRLSHKAEVAVFSIVQEAITNARKHAHASRMEIRVTPTPGDDLVVIVRDDGVGFDVSKVTSRYEERGSLGMLNMKERADIVEGDLNVTSRPGQGTAITLRLPLTPNLAPKSNNGLSETW
jgi:signal transduction histidine kinase